MAADERIAEFAKQWMESLAAEVAESSRLMYAECCDEAMTEAESLVFDAGVQGGLACALVALEKRGWLVPPVGDIP
jgi:hypothetical protein